MKFKYNYTILLIVMLSTSGIVRGGIQSTSTPNTNPLETYNAFWELFHEHYGLFDVKHINWDSIGNVYRSQITSKTTDEELYSVFCEMIKLLNDNHVNLYPTTGTLPVFPGGLLKHENGKAVITKVQEDYALAVVKALVMNWKEVTPNLRYGKLNMTTGYINISGTDDLKKVKKIMPAILQELKSCKGIVVDIRGFYGGMDAVSQYLAGCFAASQKTYMVTKKRNGKEPDNFTQPIKWNVTPQPGAFTGPVVVLSSAFTQSAGETFLLAMHELDNVKVLGDTTAGSYSDNPTFELPNGWMVSLSVGDYRAADGKSYEGIGTAPDIYRKNTRDDLLLGKDPLLSESMNMFDN